MIYKVGMLCKHFKGHNLLEKNIYKIIDIGIDGSSIDEELITYTGDGELKTANNLVVYSNIFQDGKLFCREYEDISSELSDDKKELYLQNIKVEPLTSLEIEIVNSDDFIASKSAYTLKKYR